VEGIIEVDEESPYHPAITIGERYKNLGEDAIRRTLIRSGRGWLPDGRRNVEERASAEPGSVRTYQGYMAVDLGGGVQSVASAA